MGGGPNAPVNLKSLALCIRTNRKAQTVRRIEIEERGCRKRPAAEATSLSHLAAIYSFCGIPASVNVNRCVRRGASGLKTLPDRSFEIGSERERPL